MQPNAPSQVQLRSDGATAPIRPAIPMNPTPPWCAMATLRRQRSFGPLGSISGIDQRGSDRLALHRADAGGRRIECAGHVELGEAPAGVEEAVAARAVEKPADDPPRAVDGGKRVAIVNDVINVGSAMQGTFADLQNCGAVVVDISALLVLGTAARPSPFNAAKAAASSSWSSLCSSSLSWSRLHLSRWS